MKQTQLKTFELLLAAGAVITALALRAVFFYTSVSHMPTSTDEAVAALMAKAIFHGARPLLFWGAPYQFPLESYLMAPFWPLLDTNAFGARVVPAILGAFSIFGFWLLICRAFEPKHRWPGILLILLPSAYLTTLQTAYFIPQYTMTLVYAWVIPLLTVSVLRSERALIQLLLLGFICGMALANHLLSLPLVAVTTVAVCLGSSFGSAVRNTILYLISFTLGLAPYLATLGRAKSSAGTVTDNFPISTAFSRLFSGLPNQVLEVVLGFNLTLFPDLDRASGIIGFLSVPGLYLFWAVLMFCSCISLYQFCVRSWKARWPTLSIYDVFVGTAWACIMAFVISKRSRPDEYRYLLPLAWTLPMLVSYAYAASAKHLRYIIGAFAVILALMNAANTLKLIDTWRSPNFASGLPELQDIAPVISFLQQQDISHCYASFWLVNRITYETDEAITCSQPYNERFPGWPLPYLKEVNESGDAAYVLTDTRFSRFPAKKFLSMLEFHRIAPQIKRIGVFKVMYDFRYKDVVKSLTVNSEDLELSTNDINNSLESLTDGDSNTYWRSDAVQNPGTHLQLNLKEAKSIHRVRLYFNPPSIDRAPKFKVEVSKDGSTWSLVRGEITPTADRIKMTQTHPIFERKARQDISFEPSQAIAVRITAEEKRADAPWELAEIEIFEGLNSRAE